MCSVYFFKISIHALREEGDLREPPPQTAPSQFLSTPSARRATAVHGPEDLVDTISIHALREEGDSVTSASATRTADFYPRPPRGGRPSPNRGPSEANDQFLSTPSARRATWCVSPGNTSSRYFYPRPPRGGRPRLRPHLQRVVQISIHALREEGDQKGHTERRRQAISIHALREEGDIPESYTELDGSVFLSTPSARRATELPA